MSIRDKRDNFMDRYDPCDRKTWRNRPKDLTNLGTVSGGYRAWFYAERGKAMLAIGCRRFTLGQAQEHWGSAKRVYKSWSISLTSGQYIPPNYSDHRARSTEIVDKIIPKARRLAASRNLK